MNNRITFTITGNGFYGDDWIKWMEENDLNTTDNVKKWIKTLDEYPYLDESPRESQELGIVLVLGNEIKNERDRTVRNYRALAVREFGLDSIEELQIAQVLHIRQKFSNKDLAAMGLSWIAIPKVFAVSRVVSSQGDWYKNAGPCIYSYAYGMDGIWSNADKGAFALVLHKFSSRGS